MSLNAAIIYALLSMDAYNRGYDASIELPAEVDTHQLGNAIIRATIRDDNIEARNIGFYALAYDYEGKKIISYRGTDYPTTDTTPPKDRDNGWALGFGLTRAAPQGRMAIGFYQEVSKTTLDTHNYWNADILVTGHSLGGGLAGYVGSIYGRPAALFDSMAFEAAAKHANDTFIVEWINENQDRTEERVHRNGLQAKLNELADDPRVVQIYDPVMYDQTTFDLIYRDARAANGIDIVYSSLDTSFIGGFYLEGDILSANRLLQSEETLPQKLTLDGQLEDDVVLTDYDFDWSRFTENPLHEFEKGISSVIAERIMRHSMSSLVIRLFADSEVAETGWQDSARHFWPIMYDDKFAADIGLRDAPAVVGQLQIQKKYSDILRTIIAYSAINEGPIDTGARPFGDTGIRALYDDANDLGKALVTAGRWNTMDLVTKDISRVFLHFSGQLALNKVMMKDATNAVAGVLDYSGSEEDHSLSIDVSDEFWESVTGSPSNLVAFSRDTLVYKALGSEASYLLYEAGQAWGDSTPNVFDRVTFALGENGAAALKVSPSSSDRANLFIGADSDVVGYNGHDTVLGSAGNDLLFGSGGDDVIRGSGGDDVIVGGLGIDTADYGDSTNGVSKTFQMFQTINDGMGGEDRLRQIEQIAGSDQNDSFVVRMSEGFTFIDGGEGTNDFLRVDDSGYLDIAASRYYDVNAVNFVEFAGIEQLKNPNDDRFKYQDLIVAPPLDKDWVIHPYHTSLDYSAASNSIHFDLRSVEFLPTEAVVREGVITSAGFTHHVRSPSLSRGGYVDTIYGSNHGDTYELHWFNYGGKFYTGTGDDVVRMPGASVGGFNIHYSGGHDTYFLTEMINQIRLVNTIHLEDIHVQLLSSTSRSFSAVLTITGHGSITLEYEDVTDKLVNIVLEAGGKISFVADPWYVDMDYEITGTSFVASTYTGTMSDDILESDPGANQTLIGRAGSDVLYGYDGADALSGGVGDDLLDGGAGNDILEGGYGADQYIYTSGLDQISDDGGMDELKFGTGISIDDLYFLEFLEAQNKGIRIVLNEGVDELKIYSRYLGSSKDLIDVVTFDDGSSYSLAEFLERMRASTTPFNITGGSYADVLTGNHGDNRIYGLRGSDTLVGLAGNDFLDGGDDEDTLDGGVGDDTLVGGYGWDILVGGDGDDHLQGGNDGDTLIDLSGNNILEGGPGGDDYEISKNAYSRIKDPYTSGNSEIRIVDAGTSELRYSVQNDVFQLHRIDGDHLFLELENLATQRSLFTTLHWGENDSRSLVWFFYKSTEGRDSMSGELPFAISIDLLAGDDYLNGSDYADIAKGGAGNDTLHGLGGDDILDGGLGNDVLNGGPGDDTIVFSSAFVEYGVSGTFDEFVVEGPDGRDRISDVEHLQFSDRTMTPMEALNGLPPTLADVKTLIISNLSEDDLNTGMSYAQLRTVLQETFGDPALVDELIQARDDFRLENPGTQNPLLDRIGTIVSELRDEFAQPDQNHFPVNIALEDNGIDVGYLNTSPNSAYVTPESGPAAALADTTLFQPVSEKQLVLPQGLYEYTQDIGETHATFFRASIKFIKYELADQYLTSESSATPAFSPSAISDELRH